MLISETQYAAAFYNGQGDNDGYHIFDDIGCMVRGLRSARTEPQKVWVHDLPSTSWISADSATFVYSRAISTPMSYGYVAFRDAGTARAYAAEHSGHVIEGFEAVAKAMEEIAK
jgi:copper chaperone NosL